VLTEGLTDWVPVDAVIGWAREAAEGSGGNFKPTAIAVIEYLILGGLMVAGDIGKAGFESWTDPPLAMARRVIAQCESFDWNPLGAACWLSNTKVGDERVR
jgi:hypothetical protein